MLKKAIYSYFIFEQRCFNVVLKVGEYLCFLISFVNYNYYNNYHINYVP